MCQTCGCAITPASPHGKAAAPGGGASGQRTVVDVLQNLLAENDRLADHNRGHFDAHGVLAINLMSSPGAGKTALLEATILALKSRHRIAVIEGDLETDNDARRIRAHGVPAVQITTGTACHLDAASVHRALHDLPLAGLDLLFIENVGNLVCPADFDVGQHLDVVLLSVPEGDDKPEKYPVIFRNADLVLITKIDLLPHIDEFDVERARRALSRLRGGGSVVEISAKSSQGLGAWISWLTDARDATRHARRDPSPALAG